VHPSGSSGWSCTHLHVRRATRLPPHRAPSDRLVDALSHTDAYASCLCVCVPSDAAAQRLRHPHSVVCPPCLLSRRLHSLNVWVHLPSSRAQAASGLCVSPSCNYRIPILPNTQCGDSACLPVYAEHSLFPPTLLRDLEARCISTGAAGSAASLTSVRQNYFTCNPDLISSPPPPPLPPPPSPTPPDKYGLNDHDSLALGSAACNVLCNVPGPTQSCILPGNLHGVITYSHARISGHGLYYGVSIGGRLTDGSPSANAILGRRSYAHLGSDGAWGCNGFSPCVLAGQGTPHTSGDAWAQIERFALSVVPNAAASVWVYDQGGVYAPTATSMASCDRVITSPACDTCGNRALVVYLGAGTLCIQRANYGAALLAPFARLLISDSVRTHCACPPRTGVSRAHDAARRQ
jgi:hypothetical protein